MQLGKFFQVKDPRNGILQEVQALDPSLNYK